MENNNEFLKLDFSRIFSRILERLGDSWLGLFDSTVLFQLRTIHFPEPLTGITMICGNSKQQLDRAGLNALSICTSPLRNAAGDIVDCGCPYSEHPDELLYANRVTDAAAGE